MQLAENGVSGGSGKRQKLIVGSLPERKLLLRLCLGQERLIAQIARLAQSNEDLVQAMAEDNAQEQEGEARHL